MPNKLYALEWLNLSFKNLEASRILNEAYHFTDVIGLEVHQALEKILKSVLAYNNAKINSGIGRIVGKALWNCLIFELLVVN